MGLKGWAITAGLGAAAGAVAIMMMPRQNPARKLAAKAASKVEDAAYRVTDSITNKMDLLQRKRACMRTPILIFKLLPEYDTLQPRQKWRRWDFQRNQ